MVKSTLNYGIMMRILGWVLAMESAFMVPALLIALRTRDLEVVYAFFISMLIALGISAVMWYLSRNTDKGFYAKEGLVCTGLAWVVLSLIVALPF
jgi:trk system potassium uptake protein TrkH